MAKVAFIGLGVMGYPMAGHLAAAGHEVTVFNRSSAKAKKWAKEHKGKSAATPASAAKGADFVFCFSETPLKALCNMLTRLRAVRTSNIGKPF